MPSEVLPNAELPNFDRDNYEQQVLGQIEGLSRESQVAIAARATWRVIPLMFIGWHRASQLATWWGKYGQIIVSRLAVTVVYKELNLDAKIVGELFGPDNNSAAAEAAVSNEFAVAHASIATFAAAHAANYVYGADDSADQLVSLIVSEYSARAISHAAYAAWFADTDDDLFGGELCSQLMREINWDIRTARQGGSEQGFEHLWVSQIDSAFLRLWKKAAEQAVTEVADAEFLFEWLMVFTNNYAPEKKIRDWFNEWWLNHPKNTGHVSAFEEWPPSRELPNKHECWEPFIQKKIYKDPVISSSLAGDGVASKLTDTAEKCKEALRAFVASGETEAPITVSVEAPWGAGKTSFLHHLRDALEGKDRIPTVWFNPWKHEAGKTLWAAFAVAYERQMAEKLSWLGLWRRRLILSWLRLCAAERILLALRVVMWGGGVAALGWLWCHGEDFAKDAESKVNSLLAKNLPVVGIPLLLWGFVKDMVGSFSSPLKIDMVSVFTRNQHEDGVDDLHRFHEDFERLMCAYTPGSGPLERFMTDLRSHTDPNWPDLWNSIARAVLLGICRWVRRLLYTYSTPAPEKLSESPCPLWSQDRVVVFIDDLDRCEAPKAAEVLQSLHLMLSGGGHERRKDAPKPPGVICILGMDREKVAAAVAAKHEKLLPLLLTPNEKDGKVAQHQALGFGHEFLEKFIQITLHLPGLAGQDQDQYLRMITGWKGEENAAASPPEAAPGSAPLASPSAGAQPAEDTNPTPRPDGERVDSADPGEAERLKAEEAKRTRTAVTEVEVKLSDGQAAFLCASYVIEALEHNPRRLKQFVNLFRLRLFLSAAMRLLDIATLDPKEKHRNLPGKLSCHDIAKLVALDLCCPQTMSTLREEAGVSLEALKERIKKEHSEPRQAVILKMLDSGINGDSESNSAYDLGKAPLEMYFQQIASVAQAPEAPVAK